MSQDSFTRRGFLYSVAAVGGEALVSQSGHAYVPKSEDSADVGFHPVADRMPGLAKAFPMGDVRLSAGPFKEAMEINRAFLYSLPTDRLAYNFRVTAGIPTGRWLSAAILIPLRLSRRPRRTASRRAHRRRRLCHPRHPTAHGSKALHPCRRGRYGCSLTIASRLDLTSRRGTVTDLGRTVYF